MLVLNTEAVYKVCEPIEIIEAVENAFLIQNHGHFLMPDRLHLTYNDSTQLVMPCISEDVFCTKLVSVNPGNRVQKLPVIRGTVQLASQTNGEILALLNGSTVTALRTGAVGAVAVKYLTNNSTCNFGLIGTGVQGLHVLWMISQIRKISEFNIYDYESEKTDRFCSELKEKVPSAKIFTTTSKKELLARSEVIITATSSPTPVLPDDISLLKNKTYICIGSFRPAMGELPRSIYSIAKNIYVDVEYAKSESGDVAYPLKNGLLKEDDIILLNKIITGSTKEINGTVIFKSVGMALFDLTTSYSIYQSALSKKVGNRIRI